MYRRVVGWFTRPESPEPLAWFRIAVAAHCLAQVVVIGRSFLEIYGQYGFVQWAITRANLYEGLPHIGDVALMGARAGLTPDQTVWTLLGIYVFVLVGLLLGAATRVMAVVAWCIHFLWIHAGGGLVYGMDVFTHIALFYCMFMPAGRTLSLDAWIRGARPEPSVSAGVTRRMLQLQLCIVYFSAGVEKAMGEQWWNGEAMWRAFTMPIFRHFDFGWMAWVPWLPVLIGVGTMFLEVGYCLAIWNRRLRTPWLALVMGMHLMIGLTMGMWLFGLIMIVLNVGAFGAEALADARALVPRLRAVARARRWARPLRDAPVAGD
jgi:hypothetical protein